jgi:hypothetical protein
MKHIVNVSGGMASAVALFRVLERFGGGRMKSTPASPIPAAKMRTCIGSWMM